MPALCDQAKWPLPKNINPQDGPFRRALYAAMLACKPLRSSCPLCVDASLLHDLQLQPAARPCTFPNHPRCLQTAQRATYTFEYREHLLQEHENAIQLLEGLYRAIWQLYIKRQPGLQSPLAHLLSLPAIYTTPPSIQPTPEALHELLQLMQATIGLAEGLLWDSWSQRCCSVCGATEDRPVIDATAKAPPGRLTNSSVGQFGPPVDWRHHLQCHHLHQLLLAALSVRDLCNNASAPSEAGPLCGRPVCQQKDPRAKQCVCYSQPSTMLGSLGKTADGHRCWQRVNGRVDCCWRWGGVIKSRASSASATHRRHEIAEKPLPCPFNRHQPDFVTSGQVTAPSFNKALLSTVPLVSAGTATTCKKKQLNQQQLKQGRSQAADVEPCPFEYVDRRALLAHLVRFHAINVVHMAMDAPAMYTERPQHQASGHHLKGNQQPNHSWGQGDSSSRGAGNSQQPFVPNEQQSPRKGLEQAQRLETREDLTSSLHSTHHSTQGAEKRLVPSISRNSDDYSDEF